LLLARGRKAVAYARAGIADYWILNLGDRVLEVYRELWHRLLGGQRLIMGDYVRGLGARRGATAAGGRSC
jgi:hypothetical protein